MSINIAVRGWIACDDQQLIEIQRMLAAEHGEKYAAGWLVAPTHHTGSWTNYVFFGADLSAERFERWRATLGEIAAIVPLSPDEYVRGLFFVSDERAGRTELLVKGGRITNIDSAERYNFLDE